MEAYLTDHTGKPVFNSWDIKTTTCAYSSATTTEIDIGQWQYIAVKMPATFDGFPTIAFLGATISGGPFSHIYLPGGEECKQFATYNSWAVVGPASLMPFRYIEIQFGATGQVSATQSVAKTLYIAGK